MASLVEYNKRYYQKNKLHIINQHRIYAEAKKRMAIPDDIYELIPDRIRDIKRIIKELDDKEIIKTLEDWITITNIKAI